MYKSFRFYKKVMRETPELLDMAKSDPKFMEFLDSQLPYSVGIEVECLMKGMDDIEDLDDNESITISKKTISSICKKEGIECGLERGEVKFRIQPGYKGFRQLSIISDILKEHFLFNEGSGIHYHIDFSDVYDLFCKWSNDIAKDRIYHIVKQHYKNFSFVLKALDSWGYKGKYNYRAITDQKGYWVTIRNFYTTFEFRIGEMTFDYEVFVKRILNLQNISKRIKKEIRDIEFPEKSSLTRSHKQVRRKATI